MKTKFLIIYLFLFPTFSYADGSYQYLCKKTGQDFVQLYELNPSDKTVIFIYAFNLTTKKKYTINEYSKANTWIDNIVTLIKHRPADRIPLGPPDAVFGDYRGDEVTYKTFYLDDDFMISTTHYSNKKPSTREWKCEVAD